MADTDKDEKNHKERNHNCKSKEGENTSYAQMVKEIKANIDIK